MYKYFPVIDLLANMVVRKKDCIMAYYELDPWHYNYHSNNKKMQFYNYLQNFFTSIDTAVHLIMLPHFCSFSSWLSAQKQKIYTPFSTLGQKHITDMEDLFHNAYRYRFILGVEITMLRKHLDWENFKNSIRDFCLHFNVLPLHKGYVKDLMQEEHKKYIRLREFLPIRRLTQHELISLIQDAFQRGLTLPDFNISHLNLAKEGCLDLSQGYSIAVTKLLKGKKHKNYISFMELVQFPTCFTIPNEEWIYIFQQLPFHVEFSLRSMPLSSSKAIAIVSRKQKELIAEGEYMEKSGYTLPASLVEGRNEAKILIDLLRSKQTTLLKTSATIAVSAQNPDILAQYIEQIQDFAKQYGLYLDVPYGRQLPLFEACLPGMHKNGYHHYLTSDVLASSMWGVTNNLGDPDGLCIGKSGAKPILFQPARGLYDKTLSTTVSTVVVGSSGAGKSLLGNLLSYQAILTGAKVLIFDPKDERIHWFKQLHYLAPFLSSIRLSPGIKDRGKLDPLVSIVHDEERLPAARTAKCILQLLLQADDCTHISMLISQAVDKVLAMPKPNMLKVVDKFKQIAPSEQAACDLLHYFSYSDRVSLLFAHDDVKAITIHKPLTILHMQQSGLMQSTNFDRFSSALWIALSDFARRFTQQKIEQFKMVLFDEAWQMFKSSIGCHMLEELIRTGRSYNAAVYMVSQCPKDFLQDSILANLGYRFIFRCSDEREAEDACRLANIDLSYRDMILTLKTGQCLFSDLNQNVERLNVCVPESNLFQVFDTRPDISHKRATSI